MVLVVDRLGYHWPHPDIARVYTIHEYLHEKQVLKYIQVYTRTKISRGDDFHVFILTIIN